jgi:flagellar basal body-associated protein FliL
MPTDIGLIIAIVGTGIALVGVVIAMMFWSRSEANSLRNEAKEDRKDMIQLIRSMDLQMTDFHRQMIDVQKKIS